MVVSETTSGKSIEKNAYSVVFQGSLETSKLTFEEYHGIDYEIHRYKKKICTKTVAY